MAALTGTPAAPAGGLAATIPAEAVAGEAPVVKVLVNPVTALPATSVTPFTAMVIAVEAGIDVCPPPDTFTVVPFTVSGSMGEENTRPMFAFTGTLPSLLAGLTVSTAGAAAAGEAPVVKQ